jgi:hypothetical protein
MKACNCTEHWANPECEQGKRFMQVWVAVDALLDAPGYMHLSEETRQKIVAERDMHAERFWSH